MLIPLTRHSVEKAILVRLLRSELAVFVPGAGNTMPSAISHGYFFADLTAAIKASLDGGAHVAFIARLLAGRSAATRVSLVFCENSEQF
jgi:hypothetical protein